MNYKWIWHQSTVPVKPLHQSLHHPRARLCEVPGRQVWIAEQSGPDNTASLQPSPLSGLFESVPFQSFSILFIDSLDLLPAVCASSALLIQHGLEPRSKGQKYSSMIQANLLCALSHMQMPLPDEPTRSPWSSLLHVNSFTGNSLRTSNKHQQMLLCQMYMYDMRM